MSKDRPIPILTDSEEDEARDYNDEKKHETKEKELKRRRSISVDHKLLQVILFL